MLLFKCLSLVQCGLYDLRGNGFKSYRYRYTVSPKSPYYKQATKYPYSVFYFKMAGVYLKMSSAIFDYFQLHK